MATGAIFSPAENIQLAVWSQEMTPRPQLHRLPDTWAKTVQLLSLSCSLGLLLAFSGGLPTIWRLGRVLQFSSLLTVIPTAASLKKKVDEGKEQLMDRGYL